MAASGVDVGDGSRRRRQGSGGAAAGKVVAVGRTARAIPFFPVCADFPQPPRRDRAI